MDYEYILTYFIDLFDYWKDDSKILKEKKFKNILMDLKNKDKITIQKYNNKEYDKIIEKIDEDKDEFIFSIDIFVLIFYRQNHYQVTQKQ